MDIHELRFEKKRLNLKINNLLKGCKFRYNKYRNEDKWYQTYGWSWRKVIHEPDASYLTKVINNNTTPIGILLVSQDKLVREVAELIAKKREVSDQIQQLKTMGV